jgi:hypothetical protein
VNGFTAEFGSSIKDGPDSDTFRWAGPMQRKFVAVVVAISFLVTACSVYTPTTSAVGPASGIVRFSLTDAARSESLGELGSQVVSVEGEVRSADDSAVTVAVSEVARVAADNQELHGETVTIPTRYIARVEQKRTQVARSVLLAGAAVAAVVWLGVQAGHGDVSSRKSPGPPPPGN